MDSEKLICAAFRTVVCASYWTVHLLGFVYTKSGGLWLESVKKSNVGEDVL